MYTVYLITNLINNKKYVGITSKTMEQRWYQHVNSSTRSKYVFHQAIRKYGSVNFKQEILEEGLTEKKAKEREQYYIQYYNTYAGNKEGYNSTLGGDDNTHLKGENSPVAKLTQKQVDLICEMLMNTSIPMEHIAIQLELDINKHEISSINDGTLWYNEKYNYPIRKNTRTIAKQGTNNPQSKLTEEQVLEIIYKLRHTKIQQKDLAIEYNVCANTINFINTCKTWTHLHSYKENIRRGI